MRRIFQYEPTKGIFNEEVLLFCLTKEEKERMTRTPNHEEIIEFAKELHFKDMARSGVENFNNPETSELAENGFLALAQTMLMRSEDSEYKAHIEEEARRLDLIKEKKGTFTVVLDLSAKKPRQETNLTAVFRLGLMLFLGLIILRSLRL